MQLLPLLLAAPLLVWIAWTDFRFMRIRNSAVLAAIGIFILTVPLIGLEEAMQRLLAAALIFGVAFGLFAARMMGGGDVKMGAALTLFIPSGTYALFATVFSAAILAGIALILTLRSVPILRRTGPVSLRARGTFPMGLAFALAGLAHLGVLASAS
ncbi:prepilin peptidase [Rubellimicrobium roseum]|uniref:Prepilin type IV endopeptidase peptidase domain-containing protein n=1 Tax=Rubellimicrobium roseum TaxID=687525 RepID=A0A5C4N8V5_9RHOB|nr:prepilin peptidase [Rubellimicrobium roseum]TNC59035.1 hypothetical protein FHG71_23180 [Rubellimicrobium roseum]